MENQPKFEIGDSVRYASAFLKSIHDTRLGGDIGTILSVDGAGLVSEYYEVEWTSPDGTTRKSKALYRNLEAKTW